MSTPEFWIQQRDEALEKALLLPLPDAVYAVVHYNGWVLTEGPNIDLSELESVGSQEEILEWSRKSHWLRSRAYDVGDAGLRKDGSYDNARKRFLCENPGFGEVSYERAIGHGYQMAR